MGKTGFNSVIQFSEKNLFSQVTQSADIYFTLASTGNLEDAYYTVQIIPDGSHSLSIDTAKFFVIGAFDKSQYNTLYLYNQNSVTPAICRIVTQPKYTTLGTPASLTLTPSGSTTMNTSWSSVANTTYYLLERDTNSGFTSPVIVYYGSNTSYSNTGLTTSTLYYYRVSARAYGYTTSAYRSNSATTGAGAYAGKSFDITTSSNWMTIANSSGFVFKSGGSDLAFSVGGWFKITSSTSFYLSMGGVGSRTWVLDSNGLNIEVAILNAAQTGYLYKYSGTVLSVGTWAHVAFTYDGSAASSGLKLYLNGSLATVTDGSAGTYGSMNTTGTAILGENYTSAGTNYPFRTSGLFIANRVLTASEITAAYNSGTSLDLTGASFYSSLVAYYKFNSNMTDSSSGGTHTGSATTATYNVDVP